MKHHDLTKFDLNQIKIMTYLYEKNVFSDDILDVLTRMNFEYHNLIEKKNILEENLNYDFKTKLLKYRDDYLGMILKSASRMADRITEEFYTISYVRFDIDDFSNLNNRFGHHRGDRVLVDMANLLKENSRPTDYIIRFGGEEFDVILPLTEIKGVVNYLDKIFMKMKALQYDFDNTRVSVTASAGVSSITLKTTMLRNFKQKRISKIYSDLQKKADGALYDAKLSGKNRYKIFNSEIDYQDIREKYSRIRLSDVS